MQLYKAYLQAQAQQQDNAVEKILVEFESLVGEIKKGEEVQQRDTLKALETELDTLMKDCDSTELKERFEEAVKKGDKLRP